MKVFPLQSTRNNFKIKACSCSSSDRLGVGRPASSIASLISGRASWPKGFSAPTPFSSSHHSPPIFRHDLFSAPLPPATTKLSAALLAGPDKVILLSWLVEVSGLCSDEWDILYLAPRPPHYMFSSKTAGKLEVGVSSVLCQVSPSLLHAAFAAEK